MSTSSDDNKVIIYADLISQPARAVYWFCLYNNIPHELSIIRIGNLEQTSESYAKINPFKKIPAIKHQNKVLYESHTILRYLAQAFKLEKFYNVRDLNDMVAVDTYLDWHHLGLRRYASTLFFQKFLVGRIGVKESQDFLKDAARNVPKALKEIETIFLKNGQNKFLAGGEGPTIADFSSYCEVKQLAIIQYDFKPYPILMEWMKRMEELKGYLESHKILLRIANHSKL
eukprot:gene2625-3254_t